MKENDDELGYRGNRELDEQQEEFNRKAREREIQPVRFYFIFNNAVDRDRAVQVITEGGNSGRSEPGAFFAFDSCKVDSMRDNQVAVHFSKGTEKKEEELLKFLKDNSLRVLEHYDVREVARASSGPAKKPLVEALPEKGRVIEIKKANKREEGSGKKAA